MKKLLTFALALAVVAPGAAIAAKPPKGGPPNPNLMIKSSAGTVNFGRTVTISGQLKGGAAGTTIELQQNPYPYTGGFKGTSKTAVTDANGSYSIAGVQPQVHTQYKVIAKTSPPSESAVVTVLVRIKVSFSVSDSTPKRGAMVRFYGTAAPAHDGKPVLIQRRSSTGSYKTITRTTLIDNGTATSKYSKKVRVRSNGTYRIVVVSADQDHMNGTSRTRTLRVH